VPHLIVEFSSNIEHDIGLEGLLDRLHGTALETGVFPIGGLRIRAIRMDHYRIADNHPDNGYVHVTAWIGHGRPLDVRKRAGSLIFEALTDHLKDVYERRPLAISFNMQEFHPELNFKQNNLHEYVRERGSGAGDRDGDG
jgi:5-carboxymethyl-2-hydroxymuconate isomerase